MRLIDADELLDLYSGKTLDDTFVPVPVIRQNIKDMTTVQPKKGKWLTKEYGYGDPDAGIEDSWFTRQAESGDCAYCSECGSYAGLDGSEEYVLSNFCPNCGAEMEEEK